MLNLHLANPSIPPRRHLQTRLMFQALAGNSQPLEDKTSELIQHAVLEMMASIMLTYSAFYIPDSETDYLKQYVSSICVFTVVMSLKDSHYFFPDGTPLVTIMLWAATLYTTADKKTRWYDIFARIGGQIVGWAIVFVLVWQNRSNHIQYAPVYASDDVVHSFNECIGTMLECIAITFATIPLVTPYVPPEGNGDEDGVILVSQSNAIESKEEASPPKNNKLILVAISLAAIHYVLERIFQASMNPLVTVIQVSIHYERDSLIYGPVIGQLVGLFFACLYVKICTPSSETIRKLILEEQTRQKKVKNGSSK